MEEDGPSSLQFPQWFVARPMSVPLPGLFDPAPQGENEIHPSALVDPTAIIGPGVKIGPFSVIDRGVTIGPESVLGPRVTVFSGTTLGARCQVHANAVLGDLPQDLNFRGGESHVRIGDDCIIREGVTIHRGTSAGTTTDVGPGSLLMAYSHIGHNARVGSNVILANGALLAGYSEVGDRAFVSGNCLIHQFTRVGQLAMMSGGSAAQMDVPPFCMTRTSSANTVIGLNVIGLRRAGISPADRQLIKLAFDLLYRSGRSVANALTAMEQLPDSQYVHEFHEFVRSSKRGICRFIRDSRFTDDERPPLAA